MKRRDSFVWVIKACIVSWKEELATLPEHDNYRKTELTVLIGKASDFLRDEFGEAV